MKKYVCLSKETKLNGFIPIPQGLIETELSSTTLLIYGELLSRALLSAKNGWVDDDGKVFIQYSNDDLSKNVNRSISTVKASMKELEYEGLIIRKMITMEKRVIYVNIPQECVGDKKLAPYQPKNQLTPSQKTGLMGDGKLASNKYKSKNILSNKYVRKDGESF